MPIAGATTEVTVNRSIEAVTKLLLKAKVTAIQTVYGEDGVAEGMQFSIKTAFGERQYALPIRVEGVRATLIRDKVAPRYRTQEHAARVAWRIAHDWLRAQLALIDAQMTSTEEVFFPYMVTGYVDGGRPVTAYRQYLDTQKGITQ